MFLKPDSLGFGIKPKGHTINLWDETGIDLTSGKQVRIVAGTDLSLKGKKVNIAITQEMNMVRDSEGRILRMGC